MGADGGLVFVPLRDASLHARAEVHRLLAPFYSLFEPGHGDHADDACDAWLAEHDVPRNCIVGYYGTSIDVTLDDLGVILDQDVTPCADASLTFAELCLDLETRPFAVGNDGVWHYVCDSGFPTVPRGAYGVDGNPAFTKLETWVIEQILWHAGDRDYLCTIADMRVCDWVDRLRALLSCETRWAVETWT